MVSSGQLQVALSEVEFNALVEGILPVWASEGFTTRVLDRRDTLDREPLLGPKVVGSLLLPIEIALEPARLVDGLLDCLIHRDLVTILSGTWVVDVLSGGQSATVITSDGSHWLFDIVVLVSGLATR
jgi:glycine/D-amino acid oxidase-like deaminating enzyme